MWLEIEEFVIDDVIYVPPSYKSHRQTKESIMRPGISHFSKYKKERTVFYGIGSEDREMVIARFHLMSTLRKASLKAIAMALYMLWLYTISVSSTVSESMHACFVQGSSGQPPLGCNLHKHRGQVEAHQKPGSHKQESTCFIKQDLAQ